MAELPISLKIRNYKCFGEVAEGFEVIKPINVIIGKNNTGKSALLDLVQRACASPPPFRPGDSPADRPAKAVFSATISEEVARTFFDPGSSIGDVAQSMSGLCKGDRWELGKRYVGARVTWDEPNSFEKRSRRQAMYSVDLAEMYVSIDHQRNVESFLAARIMNPLAEKRFRRIAAERDVRPETESSELEPTPEGLQVANLIQSFSNLAKMDRDSIDEALLDALNSIVSPDYSFTAIVPRKLDSGLWEVSLREKHKGLVALSASGSGLKTILCVLANMTLWPKHEKIALNNYVFAFEELENSLHPALLRRLLEYIAKRVKQEDSCVFLTTHSSVAIDMFAGDPDGQIIHTTLLPGESAKAATIDEYSHMRRVLDDLDVRASDLLQPNGIIWVEGPSDRIYINHWIAIATEGRLREGTHYQCVFYGGKLLAHLSADAPSEVDQLAFIFRVNRNAAVIIDSDRRAAPDPVNATKRRITVEIGAMSGYVWTTAGREIENYLPSSAIASVESVPMGPALGAFEDIAQYVD